MNLPVLYLACPSANTATVAPVAFAPVPPKDIFAEYGIAKLKPDGTTKTKEELQAELKVAVIKRKQQQNPNYGTIFNLGNVFKDG